MKLRILTANVALGIPNADNLFANVASLLAFHNWRVIPFIISKNLLNFIFDYSLHPSLKRLPYFQKHFNLEKVIAMVAKELPDILVLNELFLQFNEATVLELKKLGFKEFSYGLSSHYPDTTLITLIASHLETLPERPELGIPQGEQMGGGGGNTCVRFKDMPITMIGCHLACGIPDIVTQQLKALTKFATKEKQKGRQIIIAGDFNLPAEKIENFPHFKELGVKTVTDHKTCPTCLPKIFQIGCDHIFIPSEWKVNYKNFIPFGSDHLAVSVEVEI